MKEKIMFLTALGIILLCKFAFKEFKDYLDLAFIVVLLLMANYSYRRKKRDKNYSK